MKKAGIKVLAAIASAALLLVATALVTNLPAFDERLIAELEQLKDARTPRAGPNGYPLALAFLAGNDVDLEAVGNTLLWSLHQDHLPAAQRTTIDQERLAKLMGGTGQPEQWPSRFKSLECVPRVELDCADRLIAEIGESEPDPRLAVLLERFEALADRPLFDAGQSSDIHTSIAPPYGAIRSIGRLALAERFHRDAPAEFIARAARHHRFWKLMLRDGETLGVKMIAIAGIQDTLDFLSALMRKRNLGVAEARLIQTLVTPMTPAESDIGAAFLAEARMQVLSEELPLARDASFLERTMLQRNATLNGFYRGWILPMRLRAKLTASEFLQLGAYQPLEHARRAFPPSLFNWGGSRLVAGMQWDPEQFVARTHDQNGRILLVLLQAELEQAPEAAVLEVLAGSPHRNPYTGEPMQHDSLSRTIGFQCMHTAFHPPAMPDNCSVRIDER